MRAKGATAEVFLTAFRALPKKEQNIFLTEILKEKKIREEVIDIAVAEGRVKDKGRPLRDFFKEHGKNA